ncbi:MAG: hypothetical protein LBB74_06690 [Chitinispirillales bacterium]|jgi:hypothetical protein|nr:hypothetical protein [Chitinispirillales bacterium]
MPLKSAIFIITAIAALLAGTTAAPEPEQAANGITDNIINNVTDNVISVDTAGIPPADNDYTAAATADFPPVKPPSARVKYVAVVETDIDEQSGASAEISRADARLVTAELRREAVKNLPKGRYNVMTSETVIAQGSAFATECNEENCVIALGSKIGADFIVRGTISKMEAKYTLSVEIYETEDGNLVASSDPVRSENISGLVENASTACAEMYRAFAKAQTPVTYSVTVNVNPIDGGVVYRNPNKELYEAGESVAISVTPAAGYAFAGWSGAVEGTTNPITITVGGPITLMAEFRRESAPPPPKPKSRISIGAGALFASDFGGGIRLNTGELGMPSYAGGVYLSFDVAYAAISFSYHQGGGRWTSSNNISPHELPYMDRKAVTVGVSAKYPNLLKAGLSISGHERNVSLYPTLELGCELPVSGRLDYASQPEYLFDGQDGYEVNALRAVWVKAGGGIDLDLSESVYLRAEALYGARTSNYFETDNSGEPRLGHGLTVKAGVGFRM